MSSPGERRLAETVAALVSAHRAGTIKPEDTVARTYERIRRRDDPAIFIHLARRGRRHCRSRALAVQGCVRTAACSAFPLRSRTTSMSAACRRHPVARPFKYTAVKGCDSGRKLRAAGAIVIGKTNLDQFATGLVGVRSPYGMPPQHHPAGPDPGRIKLRFGDGCRRRPCADRARHRHGGIRPRASRAQ